MSNVSRGSYRGTAVPVQPEHAAAKGITIGEFIDQWYLPLYVNVEPLKAARSIRSNCAVLQRLIGALPLLAFEGTDPVDAVKRAYAGRALSTRNRMLSRVRHMTNWARGRADLGVKVSPFHRDGVRISTKQETQRDRRVPETEEQALLNACPKLDVPSFHSKLTWTDVNDIRARAGRGESQASIAADHGIGSALCSQIVGKRIWNPATYVPLTCGQEMRDRIIGALDDAAMALRLSQLEEVVSVAGRQETIVLGSKCEDRGVGASSGRASRSRRTSWFSSRSR